VAFWKFSALRLGFVALIFVLGLFLQLCIIYSAIVSVIMAWCITYLFFRKMRDEAALSLQNRLSGKAKPIRTSTEISDAMAEDEAVERHGQLHVDADRKPRQAKD